MRKMVQVPSSVVYFSVMSREKVHYGKSCRSTSCVSSRQIKSINSSSGAVSPFPLVNIQSLQQLDTVPSSSAPGLPPGPHCSYGEYLIEYDGFCKVWCSEHFKEGLLNLFYITSILFLWWFVFLVRDHRVFSLMFIATQIQGLTNSHWTWSCRLRSCYGVNEQSQWWCSQPHLLL